MAEEKQTETPALLRIEDVAEKLALGRATVYELINAWDIPMIRIGRSVRVPTSAIDSYIAKRTAEAAAQQLRRTVERSARF